MGDEFLGSLVWIEYLMFGYVSCFTFSLCAVCTLFVSFAPRTLMSFILGNPA